MSQIRFEKIAKVETIPQKDYEHKFVYDFSVKDNETFFLSNGIPVHNTLNTFHLAGVSSKSNVNQGVPRLVELLSMSKNPKTPSLTIHLKPEVNTKEKVLSKINQIQQTKFNYFVKSTSIHFDPSIYQHSSNIPEDKNFIEDHFSFFGDFINTDYVTKLSPWVLRIEIHPLYLLNKKISLIDICHKLKIV